MRSPRHNGSGGRHDWILQQAASSTAVETLFERLLLLCRRSKATHQFAPASTWRIGIDDGFPESDDPHPNCTCNVEYSANESDESDEDEDSSL